MILLQSYIATIAQSVENPVFGALLSGIIKNHEISIDVSKAKDMTHALLLDARDSAEFVTSRIPGAMRIGYSDFRSGILQRIPYDMPLIIYCSVGARSEEICLKIRQMGFTQAFNLYGGIFEWINRGNIVTDIYDRPVKRVHAYNKTWGVWVDCPEKIY